MDASFADEVPRSRVAVLLKQFSQLADDPEPWRIAYSLAEVLLLLASATIARCDDFDDIVARGEHHLDFLRRFSPFHHGIPCVRRLQTLINRLYPVLFGRCFESRVKELWPSRHDLIAIDGKTSRRTSRSDIDLDRRVTGWGAAWLDYRLVERQQKRFAMCGFGKRCATPTARAEHLARASSRLLPKDTHRPAGRPPRHAARRNLAAAGERLSPEFELYAPAVSGELVSAPTANDSRCPRTVSA
jgi:hypothetical protein